MIMRREPGDIHSGSSFDDFLEEEGIQNEVISAARRVTVSQLERDKTQARVTRKAIAPSARKTSRA